MSNDKKLKIAMIGHKRIPSREGGVEIVVYELSNLMAKAGNRVDVYNRSGAHVSGEEFKSDNMPIDGNIKIITVPTPKSKTLNAFVYSFLAAVRSLFGRYDVVHFHRFIFDKRSSFFHFVAFLGHDVYHGAWNYGADFRRVRRFPYFPVFEFFGQNGSVNPAFGMNLQFPHFRGLVVVIVFFHTF